MNILIVDDQPSIVASLLTGISWHSMGFDNVFTAISVLAAKEILLKEKVDILLTDIEMPVENGISLLAWVREQGLDVEGIFLTSHPDFFYAKQAISLGAVDYVLQPAKNDDIIRAVENARARIMKYQRLDNIKINKFSSAAQNTAIRSFFESWPAPGDLDVQGALEQKVNGLKEMGINCHKEEAVCVLWTEIVRWLKIPQEWMEILVQYQEHMVHVLGFILAEPISYSIDDSHFCSVVFSENVDALESHIRLFQDEFLKATGAVTYICAGWVPVYRLRQGIDYFMGQGTDYLDHGARNYFMDPHLDFLEMPWVNDEFRPLAGARNYKEYYEQILEYIRNNIDLPLTRQHIAGHLFLSPDYVNSIVKNCTGYSCTELIIRVKMSYAKKLLETTGLPVGEIAQKAGYTSFAYFSKVYKDIYGKKPSESRNA